MISSSNKRTRQYRATTSARHFFFYTAKSLSIREMATAKGDNCLSSLTLKSRYTAYFIFFHFKSIANYFRFRPRPLPIFCFGISKWWNGTDHKVIDFVLYDIIFRIQFGLTHSLIVNGLLVIHLNGNPFSYMEKMNAIQIQRHHYPFSK